MRKITPEWKYLPGLLGGGNYSLSLDGFFISYNPNPGVGFTMFASDSGGPETALCKDGKFFILNGDYRAEYERLAPKGFDACKAFFDQQSAHARSSWSEPVGD